MFSFLFSFFRFVPFVHLDSVKIYIKNIRKRFVYILSLDVVTNKKTNGALKMKYKEQEIKEHLNDYLIENNIVLNDETDLQELHHDIFNTDYYMIGYANCIDWLGESTFQVIDIIKEYEEFNFGEIYTDLTNPEKIVNMYVYIIVEELLYEKN